MNTIFTIVAIALLSASIPSLLYFFPKIWKKVRDPYSKMLLGLNEAWWILLISNASVLLLSFIKVLSESGGSWSPDLIWSLFVESFNSGELFLYLCTLLAPTLYLVSSNLRASRYFPLLFALLAAQMFLLSVSAVMYAMHHTGALKNYEFAQTFASWVYPLSIVIWISVLFYRRLRLDNIGDKVSDNFEGRGRKAEKKIENYLEESDG